MNNDYNNQNQNQDQTQNDNQQYPQQQYPQQQYQQQYYQQPVDQPGKGVATASMVCGIISLVTFWMSWGALLGVALGIVAVVLSVNAKKQGFIGGMATAGLVMGIIGAILSGVIFIACTACVCIAGTALGELGYYASNFAAVVPFMSL